MILTTTQKTAKPLPVINSWLVPIILIGFAVRLYRLGAQSLWYDETVSAFLAGQPVPDLIAHTARDIHPPVYYLFLHTWTGLAGQTEFALAFFSVIFGLLLLPLTYLLARLLATKTIAVWATFLVAVSPFQIWYSQEVRMYTLGAALGLAAAFCALAALEKSNLFDKATTWKVGFLWLGYVIFATAGLYTLYYVAFLLLYLNLLLLYRVLRPRLNRPALPALFLANSLVLIAYLPWLPVAWRQATQPPVPPWRDFQGFSLWRMLLESWSALSLGQSVEPAHPLIWPLLILILILVLLGLHHLRGATSTAAFSPTWRSTFPLVYTFGPLLLIYLLSFITPLYHVRYIFTYSPPFYILLGAGLVWLARRTPIWLSLGVTIILVATFFFSVYQLHFQPRYRSDDYRAAVKFIQSRWQPGDVILVNAGYTYTAFLYYSDLPALERQRLLPYQTPADFSRPLLLETGTVNGSPQLGWGHPLSDFYAMPESETVAALQSLADDFSRLWVLRAYDTVTDPEGLIRAWLAEHAIPIEDRLFSGESNIRAQGFLLPGPAEPVGEPVRFEDGPALVDWHLPTQTWQPGRPVYVKLWWQTTALPGVDYKMSLKLWTPDGELAAQGNDTWPAGTLYRMTDWPVDQTVYQPAQLTLPPNLPPGQYWLDVQLYHPDTLQSLSRLDGHDPVVTLGPVTVQ